jgi:hypothetical protein
MAKMVEYGSSLDQVDGSLARLSRGTVKRIVMAGAEACVEETRKNVEGYRHVVTGSMMQGVAPGQYHEDLNSGWVDVYPQGEDSRGVSNAKKAFVINYGYGGHKTARTGDKFITGQVKNMQTVVSKAMQTESDRIIQEVNGG